MSGLLVKIPAIIVISNDIIDPMDRSIPPESITKVCPRDAIPRPTDCLRTFEVTDHRVYHKYFKK